MRLFIDLPLSFRSTTISLRTLISCSEEVQQRTAALEGEYEDLESYFTKDPQVCVSFLHPDNEVGPLYEDCFGPIIEHRCLVYSMLHLNHSNRLALSAFKATLSGLVEQK